MTSATKYIKQALKEIGVDAKVRNFMSPITSTAHAILTEDQVLKLRSKGLEVTNFQKDNSGPWQIWYTKEAI